MYTCYKSSSWRAERAFFGRKVVDREQQSRERSSSCTIWNPTKDLFESLQKMASKRVTKLRLYRILLNDSRLWGRVKNVEEIFDIHYICIVNISNQISKLWPEANKIAIYKEELNSGWL